MRWLLTVGVGGWVVILPLSTALVLFATFTEVHADK
jgi:hypothetical protein